MCSSNVSTIMSVIFECSTVFTVYFTVQLYFMIELCFPLEKNAKYIICLETVPYINILNNITETRERTLEKTISK